MGERENAVRSVYSSCQPVRCHLVSRVRPARLPGSGNHTYSHQGQAGDVTAMAWSPTSSRIASGSSKGPVVIWQAE